MPCHQNDRQITRRRSLPRFRAARWASTGQAQPWEHDTPSPSCLPMEQQAKEDGLIRRALSFFLTPKPTSRSGTPPFAPGTGQLGCRRAHPVPLANFEWCQTTRAWHHESERVSLAGLPPAPMEAPAAEETPMQEEAAMTKATPGIGGCSRCCHTRGRYPSYTQDLGSHGSQRVCEDDGDNRQAPD